MLSKLHRVTNFMHQQYKNVPIYIIGFLVMLMAFQQLPIIRETYYDTIRLLLYGSFAVLILYSILNLNILLKFKVYWMFVLIIVYALLVSLSIYLFDGDLYPILLYIVPFGIITISIANRYNNREIMLLLWMYAMSNLVLGIANIFYYGNGFEVTRLVPEKNQIGPMIGYSILIFIFFVKHYKYMLLKVMSFGLVLVSFFTLLAISNRSAIVGVTIMMIFMMLYVIFLGIKKLLSNNKKEVFIATGIMMAIVLIGLQFEFIQTLMDTFWTSITYNHIITDLNALSSGRIQLIEDSFVWIKTYPLFGFIGVESIPISEYTHVFILHTWMQYGLLGSLPFLLFYLFFVLIIIKILFNIEKDVFSILVFMLLSVSYVISLLEYSYPYGPGVSQFILWMMLGQYVLRDKKHA